MSSTQHKYSHVMYVIGSLAVGGAERHVASVATGMLARGWQTRIFALSPQGPLLSQLEAGGVRVIGPPVMPPMIESLFGRRFAARLRLILAFCMLLNEMMRDRETIVHFFLPASYILGGLAAWLTGARPRIMSRRSLNNYQKKHPLFQKIESFLHPRMNLLIGNSLAVVRELETESGDRTPVRLIYNGVDAAIAREVGDRKVIRRSLGLDEQTLIIIVVANLIAYKGHEDLLNAVAHVSGRLPASWRVLCVGRDDGIQHTLSTQAENLGVSANVLWLGSRMDVQSLLSAADIAVTPSHEEGFSNAVLEAMAAGLPTVVTDVGGNAEAVLDGVTGYVVHPHDPVALGLAILKVAEDPEKVEMGARGRVRVLEKFSAESCLDAYEALYGELR